MLLDFYQMSTHCNYNSPSHHTLSTLPLNTSPPPPPPSSLITTTPSRCSIRLWVYLHLLCEESCYVPLSFLWGLLLWWMWGQNPFAQKTKVTHPLTLIVTPSRTITSSNPLTVTPSHTRCHTLSHSLSHPLTLAVTHSRTCCHTLSHSLSHPLALAVTHSHTRCHTLSHWLSHPLTLTDISFQTITHFHTNTQAGITFTPSSFLTLPYKHTVYPILVHVFCWWTDIMLAIPQVLSLYPLYTLL